MRLSPLFAVLVTGLLAVAPTLIQAQSQPAAPESASQAAPSSAAPAKSGAATEVKPLWELGLFALAGSQQAYPGSALRVHPRLALPFVIYRGPLLRADEEGMGLHTQLAPNVDIDLGLAAAFGSNASQSAVRRGMANIGTLVEFGPRLRVALGDLSGHYRWRFSLPVRGVFDLNHRLAARGISAEPELGWSRHTAADNTYRASVAAVLGNRNLANTFYGVGPADVTPSRAAYSARPGLVAWRLSSSAGLALSRDWTLIGFARWDSLNGAANRASPLVERNGGATFGVGVSWTALRSVRSAIE